LVCEQFSTPHKQCVTEPHIAQVFACCVHR
jgi:hypothetical protein